MERAVSVDHFTSPAEGLRPSRSASIRSPPRNDVPDAPTRVLDIAGTARNKVDVTVEDRLTRGFAGVDADVEPGNRRVGDLDRAALVVQEAFERGLFGPVQVKPPRHMPTRDDQRVV